METFLVIPLLVLFAFGIGKVLATRTTVIKQPKLGILDLSNGEYSSCIGGDKTVLQKVFPTLSESFDAPPVCDVLLIYGHVESGGSIKNSKIGLREIIRDSQASVVVFATDNPANNYLQAGQRKPYGRANLVMTIDRKGDVFAQFFQRLFTAMKQGTPMPVAWVKLAPQIPNTAHNDCPDTIFACELGQIAFA